MQRYLTTEEDSARWHGFPFRPGDIVISTRRRTGTTWLQTICGLLIFQTPELPAPLWHLSPWLDHQIEPVAHIHARLAAQPHRRFIKTHTPLDGLPYHPQVTYVVSGRHPLDAQVSLFHHLANHRGAPALDPRAALLHWIGTDEGPESLPAVLHHATDAWQRRGLPNVVLMHYDQMAADLPGQMYYLAARLGIAVHPQLWPLLIESAEFSRMRDRAGHLVPNFFKDTRAFFRRGTSGAAAELLTAPELAAYHRRAAGLAPPDVLTWLHGAQPAPTGSEAPHIERPPTGPDRTGSAAAR
ncbi:sulfotransferase domain-containing protein [Actinoplanes sp. LDG1-06]|uniref:Sulfotransferase domain-containing protein n=1 Tax=Paractinoplanes ovalisporus TaxID=2810368 RepID=A0ABS2A807_9ACTN|nr:sulfotransferase domain-containing protein [Actinoplanes ovalisporus]MBM2615974.1 sulfotransferase domain-containing protein [Actinoplanes ovalisporus]